MVLEYLLYVELLVFLAGVLIYGFLARELIRRPDVLPGNRPLRWCGIALTAFYGGTLLDALIFLMFGWVAGPVNWLGVGLDVVRALAWLVTLPLLLHTLERLDALELGSSRGTSRSLRGPVWLGYGTLGLFLPAIVDFVRGSRPALAEVAGQAQPLLVVVGVCTLAPSAWLCLRFVPRVHSPRLARFFRALAALLLGVLLLLVAGLFLEPWRYDAAGLDRLVRTLLLGGLLLPGALVVFYVQRYNLLRLSLSNRVLRHFLAVLALVLVVFLASPTLGERGFEETRPLVGWGLTLALVVGLGSPWVMGRALARSARLRGLFGRSITPEELDRFMDGLVTSELNEHDMLQATAEQLGAWLGSETKLLPEEGLAALWTHFHSGDEGADSQPADRSYGRILRLAPPSREIHRQLAKRGLHAVFALRVEGEVEALIGLAASPTGGGYADGELEAVQLLLRQLASIFTSNRRLAARLATERRLAEQERLGMLGLVSASLAHEIKNPLSSMKILAQTVREDLAGADEATDAQERIREGIVDLDLIVEQIDRLNETTREILGLARLREGETTELTSLVASALYVIQAEARRSGVELAAVELAEVGSVPGSPASWQTVVFNLLLNAVEHTAAGERVDASLTVEASEGEGRVTFRVCNPFEGPVPDAPETLFDPFVTDGGTGVGTESGTRSGTGGGTGLGLPLVARRVREMGGDVQMTHEPTDHGHRVEVRVSVPTGDPS